MLQLKHARMNCFQFVIAQAELLDGVYEKDYIFFVRRVREKNKTISKTLHWLKKRRKAAHLLRETYQNEVQTTPRGNSVELGSRVQTDE